MIRKTLVRPALAVLTAVAVLSGCGTTEDHNAADVSFAQQMTGHHAQAVEMSGLVEGRTTTPAVVDLAARIEKAQAPEIEQMRGWLTDWSAPEHGAGHDMAGMMSDGDLATLRAASGADFDRQWLTMMVAHHEGAIEMARTVLADGSSAAVKELAKRIISAQEAEIREMRTLLERSP